MVFLYYFSVSISLDSVTVSQNTQYQDSGSSDSGVEPASSYRKVTGSVPLVCMSKCSWARYEPQTTPDVLVGTLHGSHHHQCMNVCVNYYTLRWTKACVKCCKCTNEWKIQKSTSRFYWYICVFPSVTSEKHLLLSQTKYLFWLSFWCLQGLANKGEDPKCRHNGSRLAENTHKKNILIQRNWSP